MSRSLVWFTALATPSPEDIVFLTELGEQFEQRNGPAVAAGSKLTPLIEAKAVCEKELVIRVLEAAEYRRSVAAKALGVSRVTLYNKMKKYGLLTPRTKTAS